MSSVNPEKINLSEYEEHRPQRSCNEAWNYVKRYRKVTGEEGYKDIWICNYCNKIHTGNVGRVEAHLAGIKDKGAAPCPVVPPEVKDKMIHAVRGKDVDLRETKRRNLLPHASQSNSSGLILLAEGNPRHSTLLGITNGSGEVFPRSAEIGGNSNLNDELFQFQKLDSAIGSGSTPLNSNGARNFDLTGSDDVGAGDSSMGWLEDMWAGGSNSTSPRLRGSAGHLSDAEGQTRIRRLGNIQLSAVGGGGNISNPAQPEQSSDRASMAIAPMSLSSQPHIFGETAGSSAACAQGADAGGLFPLGELQDWQQQINGATAYANDTRTEENINTEGICGPTGNSPLNTNRETGSDSNGLTHLPPPLNTGSTAMTNTEMSSQRLNFCEISRSGIAGTEHTRAGSLNSAFRLEGGGGEEQMSSISSLGWKGWLRKHAKEFYERYIALQERKLIVETQVYHFNWINEGRTDINKWLEREREVSKRSIDLFKILNDAMSIGSTMQPVQMIQDLTKEVEDLIEESRTFDALAVNRVMDFMNCRLHRSMKDHLRVALPVLLA